MHTTPAFVFEYAIRFPCGQYYKGPKFVLNPDGRSKPTRVDDPTHIGPKHQAYTYTQHRAHQLVDGDRFVFAGCTVERVS